jgi:hypothetical protein
MIADEWYSRPVWYLECCGRNSRQNLRYYNGTWTYKNSWGWDESYCHGYGPANFLEIMAAYTELAREFYAVYITRDEVRSPACPEGWSRRLCWVVMKSVPEKYRNPVFDKYGKYYLKH